MTLLEETSVNLSPRPAKSGKSLISSRNSCNSLGGIRSGLTTNTDRKTDMNKPRPQGTTQRPSPVRCSALLGGESMARPQLKKGLTHASCASSYHDLVN